MSDRAPQGISPAALSEYRAVKLGEHADMADPRSIREAADNLGLYALVALIDGGKLDALRAADEAKTTQRTND